MRATVLKLAEHRRAERFPASNDAEVEAVGDDIYPSVLMDVSERGFRVMVDGHLLADSPVRLAVRGLPAMDALVVWVRGTVVGCQFVDAITAATVTEILRHRIADHRRGIELYLDGDA
jgi:hypothetical protein